MRYALCLLIFIFSENALSEEKKNEEYSFPILDRIDDFVGGSINDVANDFDRFFATERADDELGRSRLRIRESYRIQERANGVNDVQFRFNLKLPYLQQRIRYQLNQEKKKKKKHEEKDGRVETVEETRVNENWLFNADSGVNASFNPSIRLRGRIRKSKDAKYLIHRFVQEVTWISTSDGFRHLTTLDSDRSISDDLLFRFNNTVDWRITNKDFGTSHGPSLFQRLSDEEAVSYNAGLGTTVVNGIWFLSGYSVSINYRRNLYKDIAYIDFQPGLEFPKVWSFRRTPFIFTQLEFLFGNY